MGYGGGFSGIAMTNISTAGMFSVTQPIVTMLIALAVRVEVWAPYKGISSLLGIIGNSAMVAGHGGFDHSGTHYVIGCGMLLFSTVLFSFYLIIQMGMDKTFSSYFVQVCAISVGFVALAVVSAVESPLYFALDHSPHIVWVAIIFTGTFSGPFAAVLTSYGVRNTTPLTASIATFSEAFFNLVGGSFLLGDVLTGYQWAGGGVLVVSVVVYAWGQSRELMALAPIAGPPLHDTEAVPITEDEIT